MRDFWLGTVLLVSAVSVLANPRPVTTYVSGPAPTQLVELFTSQGCSSCPAAEQWLDELRAHPGLWQQVFPLAWHVDYWDHLGWKDKFATPQYTRRQYRYHHLGRTRAVYTPQLVLNGTEWLGLQIRPQGELPAPEAANNATLKAVLENAQLTVKSTHNGLLNVAVVRVQHSQRIYRGENAGRRLEQAFVVVGFRQHMSENGEWLISLPTTSDKAEPDALVIWLTQPGDPTPLAIAGGALPDQS